MQSSRAPAVAELDDVDVSERHKAICFKITTDSPKYPDSPIVRYTTRP